MAGHFSLVRWIVALGFAWQWLIGCPTLVLAEKPSSQPGVINHSWPGFRGFGDSRIPADATPPIAWEPTDRSDKNWSIRLPGYGQSSPIVWQDRIFVTAVSGLEKEHLHVLAVDFRDGSVIWQRDFSGTQRVADRDTVSRGAPTPVADAERIYCVFESGDAIALTHDGDVVWQRSFVTEYGELQGPHGYASSPLLVDDLLVLQVAHAGPSYVLGLDVATGENRWKADHPSQTGWSSPIAFEHQGRRGVIVSTAGSVRALDLQTGDEIWRFEDVQGNSTASPTIAGDLVIIGVGEPRGGGRPSGGRGAARPPQDAGGERDDSSPDAASVPARETEPPRAATQTTPPSRESGSVAIRLGGQGDVSQSHVAWRAPQVTSGYASPVVAGNTVYIVKKTGVVQRLDARSGQLLGQQRLPGETWATPLVVDHQIVFFAKSGAVATLDSVNPDAEPVESSISATDVVYGVAAVGDSWIVRTGRGLLRIAKAE